MTVRSGFRCSSRGRLVPGEQSILRYRIAKWHAEIGLDVWFEGSRPVVPEELPRTGLLREQTLRELRAWLDWQLRGVETVEDLTDAEYALLREEWVARLARAAGLPVPRVEVVYPARVRPGVSTIWRSTGHPRASREVTWGGPWRSRRRRPGRRAGRGWRRAGRRWRRAGSGSIGGLGRCGCRQPRRETLSGTSAQSCKPSWRRSRCGSRRRRERRTRWRVVRCGTPWHQLRRMSRSSRLRWRCGMS